MTVRIIMRYKLTAREKGQTSVWSTFIAESDTQARDIAKQKIREWEKDHEHAFVHARVWAYVLGVPMREVVYFEPEDWNEY